MTVEATPAYNLDKDYHKKREHWVGYIVTLSSGQRLYHSGDTDAIPEMDDVQADVALMPCGGTYTMTAKEAAEAANLIRPEAAIPIHYGDIVGTAADAEQFKKLCKAPVEIKTAVPG